MTDDFLTGLRNQARGTKSYRMARHAIYDAAQRQPAQSRYELTEYLRDRLFKLGSDWFALGFDARDFRTLESIRQDRSGRWGRLYLSMLLDYVAANAERVVEMGRRGLRIGTAMLSDDGPAAQEVLAEMDWTDEQSLFSFRVQSAQLSYDADASIENLRKRLQTDWLRKRYLYPLVFQAFATPSREGLDDFLSFVITGAERDTERATLSFLLRDDLIGAETLGFKCYVALLCHPYDALEILLNHVEETVAREGTLLPELADALGRMAALVPSTRIDRVVRIATPGIMGFSEAIAADTLTRTVGLQPELARTLAELTSTQALVADAPQGAPRPIAALVRMRRRPYPVPDDFNYLVNSGRSWWFCEAGRLLNGLLTAIYMLPREHEVDERRDLLRLAGMFEGITPFLATSPSAGTLAQRRFDGLWRDGGFRAIENAAAPFIRPAAEYADRMWIKAVQWELREPERSVQIAKWLAIVRRNVRLQPAFLTGIDWSWLEQVIKVSRLAPFVGRPDGLYALLLFKVEERDRRAAALRTAFEPIAEGKSLPEVVDWLIDEYGQEAIAFARYLLEVDDLLWLGLAPNRTAALAGRIYALERCIRQFGYTELLPEELFRQESNTLNSALLLSSVNAGQFEIPWAAFTRDVAAKQRDLYTAAHSLEPADQTAALLAGSKITFPYRFRNDRVVTYVYPHRLAPVVALIIAVVEDFLAHPAFGLEIILSTRFRHDTMRREFAAVLEEVAAMQIAGTSPKERREIVEELEKPVLSVVDVWLEDRMHTARTGKPKALFDVVPSALDMGALAEGLDVGSGVDRAIQQVVDWMRARLEAQLPAARGVYEAELPAMLAQSLVAERLRLLGAPRQRPGAIDKVVGAARHSLVTRATELTEWFKGDPDEARRPLAFGEIKMAADGLFEAYKERRGYRTALREPTTIAREVSGDEVRRIFDLLREVLASSLDHTAPGSARTRVMPAEVDGVDGLIFTNLVRPGDERWDRTVPGHPYESLSDAIFREGDSGLSKIAAISATLVGRPVEIVARRRRAAFHLLVPVWPR